MTVLGNILSIDLSSGRRTTAPIPEPLGERFLGGRGIAVHRLREVVSRGIDPLGPDNALILSCGMLAGTSAPASSRLHLCALSPLTGILGSSNIGGGFAARMRSCGLQALVVTGRASSPSMLLIDPHGVELVPADALWGTDTWQAETWIRKRFEERRPESLTIGPAGENRVPLACIVSDRDHAAGRTGLGAVMGSKNLKAFVVLGSHGRRPPSIERERRAVAEYAGRIREAPEFDFFSRHGGAGYTVWCSEQGFDGAYNFRSNRFPGAGRIDARRLDGRRLRSRGCPRCPVRCKAELRSAGRSGAFRPEFESMINLGAKCGLADLDALVRIDNLCTRLGLDVISTSGAIAFAMDLSARRMLPPERFGRGPLRWGNPADMERTIRQMAAAEGAGRLLGQGVRRMAEKIGAEALPRAPHVKGLELSGYHPGHLLGAALGYAVSSRGGDFNNIYAAMEYTWPPERGAANFGTPASVDCRSPEGKGSLIRRASVLTCALDALGLCKVPALSLIGDFDLENEAKLAGALLDREISAAALFQAGERIVTLERLFNLEHGLDPLRDDRLPEIFFPRPGEPLATSLTPEGFSSMRQDYYAAMGWDPQGRPRVETLRRLALPLPSAASLQRERRIWSPGPGDSAAIRRKGGERAGHARKACDTRPIVLQQTVRKTQNRR